MRTIVQIKSAKVLCECISQKGGILTLFDNNKMGIEYHFKFTPPEKYNFGDFISRVENPSDASGWHAFTIEEFDGGIYFCDNCWSPQSTIAFRAVLDELLARCDKVEIEEP